MKQARAVFAVALVLGAGLIALWVFGVGNIGADGAGPAPSAAPEQARADPAVQAPDRGAPRAERPTEALEEGKSAADAPRAAMPRDESESTSRASATPEEAPPGNASLVISVRDASSEPVIDVRVLLSSDQLIEEIPTDTRGEASFAGLQRGSYAVSISGLDGPTLASRSAIVLGEGEHKRVDIDLGQHTLTISGRALNQYGEPVPGIEVAAKRSGQAPSQAFVRAERLVSAVTDASGYYSISDLDEADYLLTTTATDRYPSARLPVRAGSDSADLKLIETETLHVSGTVSSTRGDALKNVRVFSAGAFSKQTHSGDDGGYEFSFPVATGALTLVFRLPGYREEQRKLEYGAASAMRLDVRLEPIGETVEVSGTLRSRGGGDVPSQAIQLHSPLLKESRRAVSDAEGRFLLSAIPTGGGYQLLVRPRSRYRDYTLGPLDLRHDTELDIELEGLGTGSLSGTMVDEAGVPLSGFHLWLSSTMATQRVLEVRGDDRGRFAVDEVPVGPLRFYTRSKPWFRLDGLQVEDGASHDVLLVLDSGHHAVEGRVLDAGGGAIAGANVKLVWSQQVGAIRSSSRRDATSDQGGRFRFTQLGPGSHTVTVRADGYKSGIAARKVGPDTRGLEIRLEPEG